MPYFVFNVRAFAQLDKLAEFDSFKQASSHAKALRAEPPSDAQGKIKVMFAHNQQLAEDLLCQIREPGPSGDD